MTRLALGERVQLATVQVKSLPRVAAARLLRASLQRWNQVGVPARPLVIIPQQLRICDPSFWSELESGHLGLAGAVVFLDGRSPFAVAPPTLDWQRELHGFSWLRHLEASGNKAAPAVAREYVLQWLDLRSSQRASGCAAEPAVQARRLLSWIAHAPFILDGARGPEYDTVLRGIAREMAALAAHARAAKHGYDRLLVLTALMVANLATDASEYRLYSAITRLDTEIKRQIHADGSHISRNPTVLIELLLDWLPLKSCFAARTQDLPEALALAIPRMLAMLRYLRLGDGAIARFNGMATGNPAGLATLLAHDDRAEPGWPIAPHARYCRMARGSTCVVADVGSPPPPMQSQAAHAGCLSFEASSGAELLFVNCGAPAQADTAWRAVTRATASHTTACIGEQSSSELVRHSGLETALGGVPLQFPANVSASVTQGDGEVSVEAAHDGYLTRLGLMHRRTLTVSSDGTVISGRDQLEAKGDRLKRDQPFALHFHLHPQSRCVPVGASSGGYHLLLADGQTWLFEATGANISLRLEESTWFAGSSGPRASLQVVVRGATAGDTDIRWSATRLPMPDTV